MKLLTSVLSVVSIVAVAGCSVNKNDSSEKYIGISNLGTSSAGFMANISTSLARVEYGSKNREYSWENFDYAPAKPLNISTHYQIVNLTQSEITTKARTYWLASANCVYSSPNKSATSYGVSSVKFELDVDRVIKAGQTAQSFANATLSSQDIERIFKDIAAKGIGCRALEAGETQRSLSSVKIALVISVPLIKAGTGAWMSALTGKEASSDEMNPTLNNPLFQRAAHEMPFNMAIANTVSISTTFNDSVFVANSDGSFSVK